MDHEGYTTWSNNYKIDLHIYSEAVSYDGNTTSDSDKGSGVVLDMHHPSDSVTTGSYPYSTSDSDNTFSDFSDAFTSPGSYREYFASGTVDITVDGENYTIEGNVTDDNGDTVSFSYSGPITEEF
ncbi:MAG: hypothetical protein HUJ29_00075 [Gammaproteobacteria bacterium]|nr:hypothetical protein [Gammaproteobacteria bacterium]